MFLRTTGNRMGAYDLQSDSEFEKTLVIFLENSKNILNFAAFSKKCDTF